jgi:hypothetical protein
MSWLLEHWQLLLLVAAAFVLLMWLWGRRARRARKRETTADIHADDPLRRWSHAACRLVTRHSDYGQLSRGEARRILRRWWHVHGVRELHDTLHQLSASPNPDNAWELLRFMIVARLGAAAQMLEDDESWGAITPIARRLQDAYDDWAAMGQAYVTARRQWQELPLDGSGDDDTMEWITDNLQMLRAGAWSELPWDLELDCE